MTDWLDRYWADYEQRMGRAEYDSSEPRASLGALGDERLSTYVASALRGEIERLQSAPIGERNHALNRCAFALAQIVAAGALDEQSTRDLLYDEARRAGLEAGESRNTIASGFRAGLLKPREISLSAAQRRPARSGAATHAGDAAEQAETRSERPSSADDDEPPSGGADLDGFWHERDLLTHLLLYARARRVAPWALLGCVLARIVAVTVPTLVLPPLVGGHASLNLYVGLVGTSGAGKGGAERVAAEALRVGVVETLTTGSGEGIAHAYRQRLRNGDVKELRDAVLFSVPEIDTLAAVAGRAGATLMPELRRAWSGEALGFAYADQSKALKIAAHAYRLCLVAGVQPLRAGHLLDAADAGTPQRFLWLPTSDRGAPAEVEQPPAPRSWESPRWDVTQRSDALSHGLSVMGVCVEAREAIDSAALERLLGQATALDGHALLARLKTAAALALLDRRIDIDEQDWRLAGVVQTISDRTRASVVEALRQQSRERNTAQAVSEAERSIVIDVRRDRALEDRVRLRVLDLLHRHGGEIGKGDLRMAVRHGPQRKVLETVVSELVLSGQISIETRERGAEWYVRIP